MTGAAPDPLDRIEKEAEPYLLYFGYVLKHELLALLEVARAAREIRDTAKWYADNDARLAHEVDHALCVEVYSLADNALARLERTP